MYLINMHHDLLCIDANRDNNDLDLGDPRRNDQSTVISVGQDHDTNGSGRKSPRILPYVNVLRLAGLLCVGVLHGDVEHLGEMLAKAVRGSGLDATTSSRDETFDSGGVVGTRELLVDGLGTLDNRDRKQILVHIRVPVQNLKDLITRLLLCKMCSMAFLPQKLARSNEGHGVCEVLG